MDDNPSWSFVSNMLKFVDVISMYFLHLLLVQEEDCLIFLIFMIDYPSDQKAKSLHLSAPLNFKIFEFVSANLELVYLDHLGLDVIVSVKDAVD